MPNVNEELSKLNVHKGKKCVRYGHQSMTGELNIEGQIHHKTAAACIDLKACKRRQRKLKKKDR